MNCNDWGQRLFDFDAGGGHFSKCALSVIGAEVHGGDAGTDDRHAVEQAGIAEFRGVQSGRFNTVIGSEPDDPEGAYSAFLKDLREGLGVFRDFESGFRIPFQAGDALESRISVIEIGKPFENFDVDEGSVDISVFGAPGSRNAVDGPGIEVDSGFWVPIPGSDHETGFRTNPESDPGDFGSESGCAPYSEASAFDEIVLIVDDDESFANHCSSWLFIIVLDTLIRDYEQEGWMNRFAQMDLWSPVYKCI